MQNATQTAPQDRRVLKTHQSLLDALITLLGRQDWSQINVQQLCDQANIARSTFYMHFNNKQELLDFGFARLEKQIGGHNETRGLDLNGNFSFLPELLDHIQKHQPMFCENMSCLNGSHSAEMIFQKFKSIIFKFTIAEIENSKFHNSANPSQALFIAGGIYGILDDWWVKDSKAPIIDVLTVIDGFVEKVLVGP